MTAHFENRAGALDSDVESLLAWVVREGTTNVVRHAQATTCRIDVSRDGDRVVTTVEDDGRGATSAEGSGLLGLRERVARAGGALAISAADGFTLQVTVPVPPA